MLKFLESLRMELYLNTVCSHLKNTSFPNKMITKNMSGINCIIGMLDNSELGSIIHQHFSSTTEHFAEEVEKCKILSPYLCKDVEKLDDLGCPKASKLLESSDAESNCSNYPY